MYLHSLTVIQPRHTNSQGDDEVRKAFTMNAVIAFPDLFTLACQEVHLVKHLHVGLPAARSIAPGDKLAHASSLDEPLTLLRTPGEDAVVFLLEYQAQLVYSHTPRAVGAGLGDAEREVLAAVEVSYPLTHDGTGMFSGFVFTGEIRLLEYGIGRSVGKLR